MKKLSILIPTVDGREHYLNRLLEVLEPQVTDEVEVVIERDAREKSTGEKRNILLNKAQGDYIAFVDDDDLVSLTYVKSILKALENNPDVVGIHLLHFNDGALAGFTYHSINYDKWFQDQGFAGLTFYYRNPNHLNPVKRDLALQVGFPNINHGEDKDYSMRLASLLKTEKYIVEPIYAYLFRSQK